MRWDSLVGVTLLGAGSLALSACSAPKSHRSPTFSAPPTTLLTSAVACLEAVEVAAGGEIVRRATGFGPQAVQRLNTRLARLGPATPALPSSHCFELMSDQAADPRDWKSPAPPEVLRELAEMTGAASVLVPVVASRFHCDQTSWRWGEPSYENETGRVDCHEDVLTFAAFLYAADGTLLWKAVHPHALRDPPDLDALADALILEAPLGEATTFHHEKSELERDALDALDAIPEDDASAP